LLYDETGGAELELTFCESFDMVLGGVRRLPTLAWLPAWPAPETAKWYLLSSGGGGSAKLGRLEAFGLRDEKPGPPISDPECIWAG
jgi:hypothetical protein